MVDEAAVDNALRGPHGTCLYIYLILNGVFFLIVAIYCDKWTKEANNNLIYPTSLIN
jgi:hypothetical protein